MDKDNVIMSCLGMILATISLVVIGMIMNGWALSTLWNWFVPPIFVGLPTLTFGKSIGIAMVAKLFTGAYNLSNTSDTKKKTFTDVFVEGLSAAVLVPLITVGIAWIVLQFAF